MTMPMDKWRYYRICQREHPERLSCRIPEGLDGQAVDAWGRELGLGVLEEHHDWLRVREWDGTQVVERSVYLNEATEKRIEGYLELARRRPELFAPDPRLPLCMDRGKMLDFTDRAVGLVFDNLPFYQVVCDLIDAPRPYGYARVIYPDTRCSGTVIVPRLLREGREPLFGIVHIFRHAIRSMSGGEFPRGFQEPDITPEENAAKELWEEFNVPPSQLTKLTLLGETRPDTGLSASRVKIYLADITGPQPEARVGHEEITGEEWLTETELTRRLEAGEILDGMTQTAMLFYRLKGC